MPNSKHKTQAVWPFVLLCVMLVPRVAPSQSRVQDSQSSQALLEEVRLLRHDMRSTAVTTQRIQIALYRLHLQDTAVTRAAKLVEDAQSRLSDLATERKRIVEEIEESEELENKAQDANERKVLEKEYLPQLRRNLEEVGVEEHKWQDKEGDAEAQVKVEQGRLDSLNGLLDQLDQALQNTTDSNKPGSLSSLPSHGRDLAKR